MSQQLQIALLRSLIGGLIAAGAAGTASLAAGGSTRVSLIVAGAAFFSYLATRGVVEGVVDTSNTPTPTVVPPKV